MTGTTPLVLIVDDSRDNREAYAEYLRFRGFRAVEAGTGADALMVARRDCPDIILLDLKLPDIHGLEVSRHVRASRALAHCRVIALSACVFPSDVAEALASGCDAFLQKPCLPDAVVGEIERVLRARSQPVPPSSKPGA